MQDKINRLRNALNAGLANASVVCALLGGLLMAISSSTGAGSWIVGASRFGPWWAPIAWFSITVVTFIGDWAKDGVPNRPAIFAALAFPSCWVGIWSGHCGDKLYKAVSAAHPSVGASFHQIVAGHLTASGAVADGAAGLAVLFVAPALVFAWRYAAKKKAAGIAARTGASPVISRTPAR
jgi:hypothetical protein